MVMMAWRKFGGEYPLMPAHSLPEDAAQQALFCDFSHGNLAPLQQGLQLTTMAAAVKAIYTEDGTTFYTWSTDTYAFRGPVLGDTYHRIYFLQPGSELRVTTNAGMAIDGGEPGSSYKVGVPGPTLAPAVATVDRTTYPDYPNVSWSVVWWYDYAGEKFQETTVTPTVNQPLKSFQFEVAGRAAGTDSEAVLMARLIATDTDASERIFSVAAEAGGDPVQSDSLPGGFEATLAYLGGSTSLNLTFTLVYGVEETRSYVYTHKNTWLEESANSPVSVVDVTYVQDVQVGVTDPGADFTDYRPFSTFRLYRTFGTTAAFLRVSDSSATSLVDTSRDASDAGDALPSLEWDVPPATMSGLVLMPNGWFAGFLDNILYMSEPYRPHTWQYSMSFPKPIRGLCADAQSLVVTDAEGCYLVMGSHPSVVQSMPLPLPQAGVSQRSMTKLEGGVAFASNDGVVLVSGSQATLNMSQKFFNRADWRSRYGALLADRSLRFAYHDGFLVATSATQAKGFAVRMDEAAAGTFTQFNEAVDATFQLPLADTLYYSKGATVYQFRAGSPYTLTWHSKDFIFAGYANFGAGFIRCSAPVVLTLYGDGAQFYQVTLPGSGYFRLPGGDKKLRWSVKLQTAGTVDELYIAESMSELKRV